MQNKESLHETDINKIPYLITFKNISRIDFVSHIIQTCIIAVGIMACEIRLNSSKSFTISEPKKVLPSSNVGS